MAIEFDDVRQVVDDVRLAHRGLPVWEAAAQRFEVADPVPAIAGILSGFFSEVRGNVGWTQVTTPPFRVSGVMVLSAPPDLTQPGARYVESTPEHKARIQRGVQLFYQLARKAGDDWRGRLYLNGEPEQLWVMSEIAQLEKMDPDYLTHICCGPRGMANSKTHFTVLADHKLRNPHHPHKWDVPLLPELAKGVVVLVTSLYHVPRVWLTAQRQFGLLAKSHGLPQQGFEVVGAKAGVDNFEEKVVGEIERILRYAGAEGNGDIAWPWELPPTAAVALLAK